MMNELIQYIKPAEDFINKIKSKLDIESIIIDDWGGAIRLIYSLNNSDEEAKAVLETDKPDHPRFVTTLCYPNEIQKSTYGDAFASKFLNIKSIEEYKMCFVNWIIKRCPTRKDIYDELKFLKDFQLLYFKGKVKDDLFRIENEIKLDIMKKISENIYDPEAKGWFDESVNIMRI